MASNERSLIRTRLWWPQLEGRTGGQPWCRPGPV